jgi:hypothetical protein
MGWRDLKRPIRDERDPGHRFAAVGAGRSGQPNVPNIIMDVVAD